MEWQFTPYVAPLFIAAALALYVAGYAWRRRQIPGAGALALLMVAVAWEALASGLEVVGTTLAAKLLAANLVYLALVTIPPAWLVFALRYTGRDRRLTWPALGLLALPSLVTLVLVWTNEAHGLMRQAVWLEPAGPFVNLAVTRGPWYWIQVAWFYALLLVGTGLLVRGVWLAGPAHRRFLPVLLAAVLAPWVSNLTYVVGLTPLPSFDLTPFAFMLTGLGFAWVLFRWQFLDVFLGLIPVARAAIVERMADAVLVLDAAGHLVDLNPAAQQLIDRPPAAVLGQPITAVFDHWPTPALGAARMAAHHTELVLGAGPTQRDFDLAISPLYRARDELVGFLVVCRDITARKRAAAEREVLLQREQAALAEAQAALHVRDEFLAIAAHELRTPLTVLRANVQRLARLLDRPAPDMARLAELIEQQRRQLARFETLNQDLLDVSQLRRGRVILRPEPVEITAFVRQVLARFEEAPERRLTHVLCLDAAGPVLTTIDPDRLDQVLTNLISNALKYSPAGGEVRVGVHPAGDTVEIVVTDQGVGISPADQAHLFQPFVRGEAVRGRIGGVGLGLYITAQIVERHGGTLTAQSEPGIGTTMTVRLPLAPPPAEMDSNRAAT